MKQIDLPVVPVIRAVVRLSPLIKGGTTGTTTLHPLSHGKRDNRGQPGTTEALRPYSACFTIRDNQAKKALLEVTKNCAKKTGCPHAEGTTENMDKIEREAAPWLCGGIFILFL